jgi:hypothetical protein
MGYSATDTITVTVSDPGRASVSETVQATTPPPPATVTVSQGGACGSACSAHCADPSCAFIHVQTANFGGSVSCSFDSTHGGGFVDQTFGPNVSEDSYNYFGYPGYTVTVDCDNVYGSYTWPGTAPN